MERVKNKIVLITGAARGIGKACTEFLSKEGALVIVTDIRDELGNETVKELENNVVYHHLDVSQENEWKTLSQFIQKNYGKLDVLVNNAAIGFTPDLGAQDPEFTELKNWHRVHAVNLDGVFLGCKYGIRLMKAAGGSIINISSRLGLMGSARGSAYASSKAAIRNHTKSVALYCAEEGYNIRCNSIHPGHVLTDLWDFLLGENEEKRKRTIMKVSNEVPLKKMGEPMDVAQAVLFLASDESKYINGTELNVDGGLLAGFFEFRKKME